MAWRSPAACTSSRSGISTEGVKVPLGPVGRHDGERDARPSARRSRRPRPRSRPGDPVRPGRRQGAAARIKDVFGEHALVHRCHRHKERNVCDLLPERDRPRVLARIRGAWALTDAKEAEKQLMRLADRAGVFVARCRRIAPRRPLGDAHADGASASPASLPRRSRRRTPSSR